MATYVNDLRLKEIATGDESGTWGTSTNTNLELIAEAFSFGTEAITTNADAHTTTIADGSTDPGRSIFLKYTGTLDSACTITLGPNTVSKMWFIENATTGSQNIIISQGSGANVTIPAGHVKAVYSDGAGSGAAIVDAFTDLNLAGTTTVDVLSVGGTLDVTGAVTADAGVSIDNITIDGTEIDLSSGDLTLDVAGDIILDVDGDNVFFKDGSSNFFSVSNVSGDSYLGVEQSDKDLVIRGNDGGSTITALSLDMSDAGTATFNHDVKLGDDGKAVFGAGDDLQIYHDGSNSYIDDVVGGGTGDLYIKGSDAVRILTPSLVVNNAANDENMITAAQDGAATLYYNGSAKIATTSTGANVTGALTEDSKRVATNGRAIAFSLLF